MKNPKSNRGKLSGVDNNQRLRARVVILVLLLALSIFSAIVIALNKGTIIKGLGENNKEYTCTDGICATCTIDGSVCNCGPVDCVCGVKRVEREVCEIG
ncbi:hypothetical protein HY772_05725 [Candidatus Woesearchaeota archaeon]|nr:hypothetical protein [Candidatus Woesearchaeota archaeon]